MADRRIEPASSLQGHVALPGDKSISHRAVLLAAIGEGDTRITGFGRSGDTESTLAAVRALGVGVEEPADDEVLVHGARLRGLGKTDRPIDCGNSAALMRLLCGLLAGQQGEWELTGDESLRSRPMERVAEPLRQMGVDIETTAGHPPVRVRGGAVAPLVYKLPVASSQVKSAVLLAALYADGRTTVIEPAPTRDHTELLFAEAGVPTVRRPRSVSVDGVSSLRVGAVEVPGDFSAAAPLFVGALLLPGSQVTLHHVGLNPRRTGLLDVLARMGAPINDVNKHRLGRELVGDLDVIPTRPIAADVSPEEVPRLVDELPLVGLAAAMARGRTVVRGAAELRVKESDRVAGTVAALRALGSRATEAPDGFAVAGVPTRLRGGHVESRGDHRLAVLGGVAGLLSREGVTVSDADSVDVSFPGFWSLLDSVAVRG